MKTMIIFAIVLFLGGIFFSVCGVLLFREGLEESKRPPPFTIVCDGAGSFSYVDIGGGIHNTTYHTREEAEQSAAWSKEWHEDEKAGKHTRVELSDEQKAKFKPCP